jgi:uncharacterized protein
MGEQALAERIDADLKEAMRERDEIRKLTLRSLKTSLTEARKSGTEHALTDDDTIKIIARAAKQRRDSIAEYQKANRADLVEKEEAELAVLEAYLPQQMSQEEVESVVRAVIAETGAQSAQDLGRVMSLAMQRTQGRAEGREVNQAARRLLSQGR